MFWGDFDRHFQTGFGSLACDTIPIASHGIENNFLTDMGPFVVDDDKLVACCLECEGDDTWSRHRDVINLFVNSGSPVGMEIIYARATADK